MPPTECELLFQSDELPIYLKKVYPLTCKKASYLINMVARDRLTEKYWIIMVNRIKPIHLFLQYTHPP